MRKTYGALRRSAGHADVFNTLLQVLDDGRLTDAQGRTVDFRNTVIIMTSNIGSEWLTADAVSDGEIKPDARERVMAEMRAHFRPDAGCGPSMANPSRQPLQSHAGHRKRSLDQPAPRGRQPLQAPVRQPPGTVAPRPGPAIRLARLEFGPEPVEMADQLTPQRPPDRPGRRVGAQYLTEPILPIVRRGQVTLQLGLQQPRPPARRPFR